MPKKSDIWVGLSALALAIWVTSGFWADPSRRASEVNSGDQALFEWLLSYGAYALTNGVDPLYTNLLNAPDSVNLSVNTSITAYAVLFAPLTMWLGAPITFAVILTLNLAASAFCWYWLFERYLGASALGAGIGGMFCGFAPSMISHANAHLNWTAQWLIPLIIVQVVRLYRGARWITAGLLLGLLVAACFSIAAEQLFFAALALAVFSVFWMFAKRPPIANVLKGLGVGALTASVFLAYPLWLHFAGPQRYHGTGFDPKVHNEDIAAYAVWPERSLAGALGLNTDLAPNPTEENSFFGVPLLVLVIAGFVVLWRRTEVKGLALTAGVFVLLSLGPELRILGRLTGVWMPEALVGGLPVFNAALPSRLALVVAPIFGLILAWLITALRATSGSTASAETGAAGGPASTVGAASAGAVAAGGSASTVGGPASTVGAASAGGPAGAVGAKTVGAPGGSAGTRVPGPRAVWVAAIVVALVPLLPLPILTRDREPVPDFIATGAWQSYVDGDEPVIAPIPLPNDLVPDGQRWQAYAFAHQDRIFRIPSGFFLGPGGPNGTGRIGPVPRPTAQLLETAAKSGVVPAISQADRDRAKEDLVYWGAQIVVLADTVHGAHWNPSQEALLETMTRLLGPPQRVEDVWLWKV